MTEDLKKKRQSNDSFWLVGQPDIDVQSITKGDDAGKYQVTVDGFDYYDMKKEQIISGGIEKVAMWMLDTDYDGRCLFPRQIFFFLIIQVTHPPLGQCLRGFRGGGREPGPPWCTAPVPDRAADRGRSSCATARRQMNQTDNQVIE